jgi:hypothetical protein
MRKGDRVRHIWTRMTGTIVEQIISENIWWIDVLWDGGMQSRTHHEFIEPLLHEDDD